jgi:hypothetical protein
MRTRIAAPFIAAALLIPLAGCSTSTNAKAASKPSHTASATPTKTSPLKLGAAWEWKDGDTGTYAGTTTVLAYRQPVATQSTPQGAGHVWAALDVKVCVDVGQITVTNQPWSLAYADGERNQEVVSGGGFPLPQFPASETVVSAGDCVRGKIMFEVVGNKRPKRVLYSAVAAGKPPIEWAVPAK